MLAAFRSHATRGAQQVFARHDLVDQAELAAPACAGSVLPPRMTSSAVGTPIRRGSRVQPPHAGMMPSFVSGRPIFVDAIRRSDAPVAGEADFVAAAERRAVDRGDGRECASAASLLKTLCPSSMKVVSSLAAHLADRVQVGAGDEDRRASRW